MMSKKRYKLWVDEHSAKSVGRSKETECKKINASLPIVLNFVDTELTDQEIRELKDYNSIVDRFRSQFPHPNAKDELNFELIGKDTSGLMDASLVLKLINEDYIIKGNQVEICPSWYLSNIERFTTYTKNEAENQAFEYATELAKLMQKGIKKGYISGINNKGIELFRFNEYDKYVIMHGRLLHASERAEQKKAIADKLNK